MNLVEKCLYGGSGLTQRIHQRPACPACGAKSRRVVDRKWFHTLNECAGCGLRYRYPRESAGVMKRFYQSKYRQSGLTTDLPSTSELAQLLENSFRGTRQDASRVIKLFGLLGISPGSTILDFGASWGYTTWQLSNAGYRSTAFEISQPRAEYAKRLGLVVETDLSSVGGDFDAVFSSHVLEHVPNPLETLNKMAELTRPGGHVIAFTPNGSADAQKENPLAYHAHWGKVHPVLLTTRFCKGLNQFSSIHVSSSDLFREVDFESDKHFKNPTQQFQELLLVAFKAASTGQSQGRCDPVAT